ncbi:MAG: class II fructose-bisphosphate aldolase [Chloroflexi bacterium]|nr:class II fructose-bisphosphate aldolase [Chloroflexota bacterium]
MKYASVSEMVDAIRGALQLNDGGVTVTNPELLRTEYIDRLVHTAVFGDDESKAAARWLIWQAAWGVGVQPASIDGLYQARARGEYGKVTVPAVNVRGMAYEMAKALVRAAKTKNCGAFIFELARSEMGYTFQDTHEFATVVTAASIREGHRGPIFIQGDHFQANAKRYAADPEKETEGLRKLIREAIAAGYGNIDIDTSTLVTLEPESLDEQQKHNVERTAELAKIIRTEEPKGQTISIGGEIGEVGKSNSTVEELRAYLDGFNRLWNQGVRGLSKVSVQTGTSHGGVVLPDGSIARVKIAFDTLETLGDVARQYGLGGAVQHGASTLPSEAFGHFPQHGTLEVHLATEFQNIMMDGGHFPTQLKDEINGWVREHCADERKADDTEEQFVYKSRKKAWGPFKEQTWTMDRSARAAIAKDLQDKFEFLMDQLNATNTTDLVGKYVQPVKIDKPIPASLKGVKSGA